MVSDLPSAPEPSVSATTHDQAPEGKGSDKCWTAATLIETAIASRTNYYPALLAKDLDIPPQWVSQFRRTQRPMPLAIWLKIWKFAALGTPLEGGIEWLKTYEAIDITREDWESLMPKKDSSLDGRSIRAKAAREKKGGSDATVNAVSAPEASPSHESSSTSIESATAYENSLRAYKP